MVRLEADPSLYATPWFLTIFAANFPLGFVSRVLDLVFLEGTAAALVKVAVCLLQEAAPLILAAHNLEELMMVMKEGLPSLPHSRLEDVISQAGSLNISRSVAIIILIISNIHQSCLQTAGDLRGGVYCAAGRAEL